MGIVLVRRNSNTMMSLAQRFTACVLLKWAAMRARMGHPAARRRKTTGGLMTKEQLLRATEMLVLDALRAYHQASSDGRDDRDTIHAQLSRQFTERLMQDLDAYRRDMIGDDDAIEPANEAWYHGKYPEPVYRFATGSVDGRNRLRAQQRHRPGLQ
jgi:hypothetical protein